ncbi:MAG: penicillin-binding transpeptidase domain-containing protein [Clostridia bacterium]|nr:penicillin-binding transpeptidase domain-containing protein [Clostridia bacterium]
MPTPSVNRIRKRAIVMTGAVVACLAALILRVSYWQIIRGEELWTKAKNQQQGSSVITAARGNIYDRNGKTLAESASVNTLICNPQDIKNDGNAQVIAEKLSPILSMRYDDIMKVITKESRYQVIKKRISAEETAEVEKIINPGDDPDDAAKALADAFSGIYFEDDSKRYYPFDVAAHVLGFTGYDNNGLQGIERVFDEQLSGRIGRVLTNQTATGTTLESQQQEYVEAAEKGNDVVLTIDETIQHFLEKRLEEAVLEHELKEGAAGIIMNPKTGEILAMATKPDFDANNPYDIDTFNKYAIDFTYEGETDSDSDDEDATPKPTEDPDNMSEKKIAAMRNKMWRNKAVSDTYEPGSTFKIVTAAAALEEHLVDMNTKFYCPGFRIVEDRQISCASEEGHGPQTFEQGVMNSCNPVFMDVGLQLGYDKFMEYFTAFGLAEKTGIELGGESTSIYYKTRMNNVDLATSAFGQGFQVTPVQLITAISAVINGGERMRPQIVKEIRNNEGVVKSYQPEVVSRVISEETSAKMRDVLEKVVSDPEATGKNAYVKGCRIGGKTGTSEKQPRGSDKRIASFVGFAPANDPELVCLIMLDEPQVANKFGGTIAAPLAGEIIEDTLNYLGIEKQYAEGDTPEVKMEVPDVRDLSVSKAKEAIADAGLYYNVKGDGAKIVGQLPKPGVMMGEESIIILYTEEDYEDITVTVPELKGMSVESVRYALAVRDLNLEIMGAGHSESRFAYSVSQSIKPGEKVSAGSVVGVEFRQAAQD